MKQLGNLPIHGQAKLEQGLCKKQGLVKVAAGKVRTT